MDEDEPGWNLDGTWVEPGWGKMNMDGTWMDEDEIEAGDGEKVGDRDNKRERLEDEIEASDGEKVGDRDNKRARLEAQIEQLKDIPVKLRNSGEKLELKSLQNKLSWMKRSEKQRGADKDRKANERRSRTAGQAEKQRGADKDRKATEREARTADQAEEQRGANKDRMANERQSRTADQAEEQKAQDRDRKKTQGSALKPGDGRRALDVLAGRMIVLELDETVDSIGRMDVVCPYCKALKWKGETPSTCCQGGKVKLQSFYKIPHCITCGLPCATHIGPYGPACPAGRGPNTPKSCPFCAAPFTPDHHCSGLERRGDDSSGEDSSG